MFFDRATIKGEARITRDGYLVAEALVARANNVQTYTAGELGLSDRAASDVIRVFRSEAEVFATDAVQSAAHRPITVDHPASNVTAENWRRLGVGDIGGEVMRDGEFIRVPIKIMDAQAVEAARTTHQEFSLGYSADLDMTPGKFGDQEFDASMKNIRVNHLALCGTARGGPELRIVDERTPLRDQEKTMKIKIGDAEVDLSDGAAVALAVGGLNAKLTDAETAVGKLTADLATANTTVQTRDGEIVAINSKLKDAEVTPAKLQEMAAARAKVVDAAKKIAPAITIGDADTDAQIRRAAVAAKLGDAAKDMTDAAIDGAFVALVPVGDSQTNDPLRHLSATDADKSVTDARAAMVADMINPKAIAA